MPNLARIAAAFVALAIVAVGGAALILGAPGPVGPTVAPPPTLLASPTLGPATPSPSAQPTLSTAGWQSYTSARYGFTLAYPPGWTAVPADHTWTWAGDATNWLTTGADAFILPKADGQGIRVSVWTVPLPPNPAIETWAQVEAWATDYCTRTGTGPCTGIHGRAVPLCIENRDCHPALLVPFTEDVQAFGTGGILPPGMLVAAVWWGEKAPEVAAYGGATRLLEAFLSTTGVNPPFYPGSQQAAASFLATAP